MKPISQLGYEQARDELIEVVHQLEQGGLDLDASLKLWERGEELAKRCEEHLAGAREKIEKTAGRPTTATRAETTAEFGEKWLKTRTRFSYPLRHG